MLLPPLTRRLVFAGLPTLVIGAVVVSAIWGDNGLIRRYELQQDLAEAHERLAEVERDNQRLLRELAVMERDPVVLERIVAEELGWSQDGATLYRFGDDGQTPR